MSRTDFYRSSPLFIIRQLMNEECVIDVNVEDMYKEIDKVRKL